MLFFLKRFLYLFFFLSFFLVIHFLDLRDRYLNNKFQENEIISITLENNDSFDFDDFFSLFTTSPFTQLDIYIDDTDEYLFENAFKLYNENTLQRKISLFNEPTLEFLITALSKNIRFNYQNKDKDLFYESVKDLEGFTKNIARYFNSNEIDNHISEKVLYGLISNEEAFYKQNIKIKIIPSNSFKTYFGKKKYFESLYETIENYFSTDQVLVTLNNKYIYYDYIKYNQRKNSNLKISFEPIVIAYSDELNNLEKSNKLFNQSSLKAINKLENKSIVDFITDSTLSGSKYKAIKKILFKYNKLNASKNTDYSFSKDFLKLESYLYDLKNDYTQNFEKKIITSKALEAINKSLIYIKSTLLSLKDNENIYKEAFFIDTYSKEVINYFKLNVNTEKITIDNLNIDLLSQYSSYDNNYYLTKITKSFNQDRFNKSDYKLIKSYFERIDSSNYYNVYSYIKLLIVLSLIILVVVKFMIRK
tara:strand:- start:456 stop:1883 length:1428 start_codon:yes stop_codon:yes gene_type:complete